MKLDPFDGLDRLFKTLSKRHLNVQAACPAEINGTPGFLGVSRGVYSRVWFDTNADSKTLFSSMKNERAMMKYKELCNKYGK